MAAKMATVGLLFLATFVGSSSALGLGAAQRKKGWWGIGDTWYRPRPTTTPRPPPTTTGAPPATPGGASAPTSQDLVDAPIYNIIVRRVPQDEAGLAAYNAAKGPFLADLARQPGFISNIEFKAVADGNGNPVDDIEIGIFHVESQAANAALDATLDPDLFNTWLSAFELACTPANVRAYTPETPLDVEDSFLFPPGVVTLDINQVKSGQLFEFNSAQIAFNGALSGSVNPPGAIRDSGLREYQSIADGDVRASTVFYPSRDAFDQASAFLTSGDPAVQAYADTYDSQCSYAMQRIAGPYEQALSLAEWQSAMESTIDFNDRFGTPDVPLPLYALGDDGKLPLQAGQPVESKDVLTLPKFSWQCSEDKLYTIMIFDNDGLSPGQEYFSYMESNIPGCAVGSGTVDFSYFKLFAFEPDRVNGGLLEGSTADVPFVSAVFEQPGRVNYNLGSVGCQDLAGNLRSTVTNPKALQAEHGLIGPVAANAFIMRSNTEKTAEIMCELAGPDCAGRPWPIPVEGINDTEECLNP